MESHVTNLETSNKFAKAGINRASNFMWVMYPTHMDYYLVSIETWKVIVAKHPHRKHFRAYLLDELLEMAGKQMEILYPYIDALYPNDMKWCAVMDSSYLDVFTDKSPIESVAASILWQKEER